MDRFTITLRIGGTITARKTNRLLALLLENGFAGASGCGLLTEIHASSSETPQFFRNECSLDRAADLGRVLHKMGLETCFHIEGGGHSPSLIRWQRAKGATQEWGCCSSDAMKPLMSEEDLQKAFDTGETYSSLMSRLRRVGKLTPFKILP